MAELDQVEGHSSKLADVRLGHAAAEGSRRARHELIVGRRGTSSARSAAALRLDQVGIDGPELTGVHLDAAAAPPPEASPGGRRPLAAYSAPSPPELSTGVQSPAPDMALDTTAAKFGRSTR
ncbi:hypothetical protein BE17_17770 [Sorangium cellulosum]|uniref:Uncharacterized protein n=1 Tax=Sorangium cellulosum TaxID=56 RepID=A0A150RTK5_SORCE|nr:hypothetical protein BE17_17770 [Sorangium cellulosum]